jgi:Na+/proline symporter
MFLTAATHGTDQLTVQRLLAAKSQRTAGWALAASGFIVCFQFALFLLIGVGLAAFYNEFPPQVPFGENRDRVVAHFIVNHLDPGIIGLTLAAVFAAAFSSSLNSLSTALVSDIVLPLSGNTLTRETQMRWAKWSTLAFGILQIGIAVAAYRLTASRSIVNEVLTIAAFTSGPMLGLYLIGVLAPSVSEKPALGGFVCGLIVISLVTFLPRFTDAMPVIWWPWYATIGSAATFASGWLLSKTPLGAKHA